MPIDKSLDHDTIEHDPDLRENEWPTVTFVENQRTVLLLTSATACTTGMYVDSISMTVSTASAVREAEVTEQRRHARDAMPLTGRTEPERERANCLRLRLYPRGSGRTARALMRERGNRDE